MKVLKKGLNESSALTIEVGDQQEAITKMTLLYEKGRKMDRNRPSTAFSVIGRD